MRKLLLLVAILFTGFTSYAQPNISSNAKSTAGGTRWYNHGAYIVSYQFSGEYYNFVPIWYDSSVLEPDTVGLQPIQYISALQALDPIHFGGWNDTSFFDSGSIAIPPTEDYQIDSITFAGAYVKNPNRPANIVDTLILSVSPAGAGAETNPHYYAFPTHYPWTFTHGYACQACPDSTALGYTIDSNDVDIANRASNVPGKVMWKVLLVDSMRQSNITDPADAVEFTFPVMVNGVPGACNIPAGYGTAITITFKSGDVVTPNQDTFTEYHHFLLLAHESWGQGMFMPYFRYSHEDRNMSNLMRYRNDSVYWPTMFLEGDEGIDFAPEFLSIGASASCANCPSIGSVLQLSMNNINAPVTTGTEAYPNPATEEVTIRFTIDQSTKATVSITNAIGQVMATQNMNVVSGQKKTAKFSTTDLAAGVYFYTVEAKGQRTTKRFVVSH